MGSNISQRDPTFEEDDKRNRSEDVFYFDIFEGDSPDEMFKQMDDVFNRILSSSYGIIGGFPKLGEVMPSEPSPRSIMLKDSDEENFPSSFVIEPEGFDLFPNNFGREVYENPDSFSYSKFSSIKTVQLPDGTVEEHKTFLDSDGTKTTLIRHVIGDASHEIITKVDKEGLKETEENFTNMDEKELPNFEKAWNNIKSNTDAQTDTPTLSQPDSNESHLNFLKKLLGLFREEELK